MPVPTPRVLGYDNALGILALQDLGDVTLQAHLGTQAFHAHAALYRQAVAHIVTMQTRGAALTSPAYLPYGIAFDVDKLTWELDFFLKHYLSAYRNAVLPQAAFDAVRAEFQIIVEELAAEPRVLCHRDYHSRNLMLAQGTLYLIDFQDARMGPDTYDLASLLRDSYLDLNDITVNELIAYFLALKGGTAGAPDFRARFDLMALQRNLKAMGTFGYQTTTRQNPVYIQYMPRTLRYVGDTVRRYPRFGRLQDLLAPHIDELR
jgi:aminoglycoside/choline kinase family phosphotransferase